MRISDWSSDVCSSDLLGEIGIASDVWPEKARDVVRIPQALKTFIVLAAAGRTEPFTTYQAMLEQLWRDRIASADDRSEEHTSELQSLMRISYAVFCLKKNITKTYQYRLTQI